MNNIGKNIKYLRKQKGLTQTDLSIKLGIKRSLIGAYEEERAEPKIQTLKSISSYFEISLDYLVNYDLTTINPIKPIDLEGNDIRILSILTNIEGAEIIPLIQAKATAGYLTGYSNEEFISQLPKISLEFPEISTQRSRRIFQIKGDSMLPVTSGTYIITEYVENWKNIKTGRTYIFVTKNDGITYKRAVNKIESENRIILNSDNPEFASYEIVSNDLLEVWKAVGLISFNMPNQAELSNEALIFMINELKSDMEKIKKSSRIN
jgi:transcriptional regulator with XRE-family HTH domain